MKVHGEEFVHSLKYIKELIQSICNVDYMPFNFITKFGLYWKINLRQESKHYSMLLVSFLAFIISRLLIFFVSIHNSGLAINSWSHNFWMLTEKMRRICLLSSRKMRRKIRKSCKRRRRRRRRRKKRLR